MKVGIVGGANIGGALTRRFGAAGQEVRVANSRGPGTLADLAEETGAQAVPIDAVVRGNEIVVVAVPLRQVSDLPPGLFASAPSDMIVLDTSNYYPQQCDGRIDAIEAGLTESRWVEEQLRRLVVRGFNSILATQLEAGGEPAGASGRIALAIAGDDPNVKAVVADLLAGIGIDAVDTGTIEEAWRQQPGSPGYIKNYVVAGVSRALAEAQNERAPEGWATPNTPETLAFPV